MTSAKRFWTRRDQKLWNKIKVKSLRQIILWVERNGITFGQTEDEMYLSALEKRLGFKFVLPNIETHKELVSFGVPENQIVEVKI